MPDILLFGATGYTGKLTSHALARRGADFAIAGRNRTKLEALAAETGDPEVRIAEVGDVDALVKALDGVKVMITCVGPFEELGQTAVEAALQTKTHYIDSTGEGTFIARLIRDYSQPARDAGIAMAPALGFDEVPPDVAASLAAEDLDRPDVTLTYSVPSTPSAGTAKSVIGIITAKGQWIIDGQKVPVRAGEHFRWAPMPTPLGPKRAMSLPLAEGHLAPLHLDLNSLRLFGTTGRGQAMGARALPVLGPVLTFGPVKKALVKLIDLAVKNPEGEVRNAPWTILAEAQSGDRKRNVVLTGRDVYGLTAEFLSTAAQRMTEEDFDTTGVLAPVQAVGLDRLQKEMIENGVSIETFES
ncbi:MAG TPA: saccharopine dehydrogenase NADP-binding domain-containing protein [Actinomycetota bacterium]|nr:saccharopine dehydrogenase NADP-binding domain-containing protein [Actinomycetota bacterium]